MYISPSSMNDTPKLTWQNPREEGALARKKIKNGSEESAARGESTCTDFTSQKVSVSTRPSPCHQ